VPPLVEGVRLPVPVPVRVPEMEEVPVPVPEMEDVVVAVASRRIGAGVAGAGGSPAQIMAERRPRPPRATRRPPFVADRAERALRGPPDVIAAGVSQCSRSMAR
jgi:hypothetical protein